MNGNWKPAGRVVRPWKWMAPALAAVGGWLAAGGSPAWAQMLEPGGGVEMGGGVPTVQQLFMTSPYINGALLGLSVIAVLMFVYLYFSLSSGAFNPPRFIDNLTKLILNRQFEQAIHLCQNNSHVFSSSIVQRVLENREKDHGVLMDMLSAEGRRRAETTWNRVGYLSEISNIAPMLGLLGTVIGMIKVFFTLTTRTVGEKAAQLSEGIAEAMGTTMFGLIVAIAAAMFYTIVKSKATRVLAEAESVCHTIADHTQRSASDPRLKRIDALAEAAKQKVTTGGNG
jgi:biopolymer transport protein ExbB